jgi:hypothetical protein
MTVGSVQAGPVPLINRRMISFSIMLATIMQTLDSTIANVALPHMQGVAYFCAKTVALNAVRRKATRCKSAKADRAMFSEGRVSNYEPP